ncbi:MAG: vitamin B12 dependent methionine synthase [candidate division KSB1 bacterium]|nr:vitamin B12 dependent methionine synthase [candidate division KSB1 bacterium]MDZ7341552.1 vitamin B12 dependent methionine synthase [candidate division KSB1 bacterium]
MTILSSIPFQINQELLFQTVRIDKSTSEAQELIRLVQEAKSILKPKAIYTVSYVGARQDTSVIIDNVSFESQVLRINLSNVERVFPFVATCGREADTIEIAADDFVKQFWLETIKAMALESAMKYLRRQLKQKFAIRKIAAMSPGSGPSDAWPIEQQRQLFSLLGNVEEAIGVRLTDSYLMIPNKSISGLFYPTEIAFETCQICKRENCRGRRAAYSHELAQKYQQGEADRN